MSYDPNLRPKGSWAANCADQPGAGMHVVLSTKYGAGKGVYFDVSVRAALEELGCTVYNPNTDMREPGWVLSLRFQNGLDSISVEPTKGSVYQLQQGHEENMGKKWGAPKIVAFIPDNGIYDKATLRRDAWAAIQCARRQWAQGVRPDVEKAEELQRLLPEPGGSWSGDSLSGLRSKREGTQGPPHRTGDLQNLNSRAVALIPPPLPPSHPTLPPHPPCAGHSFR